MEATQRMSQRAPRVWHVLDALRYGPTQNHARHDERIIPYTCSQEYQERGRKQMDHALIGAGIRVSKGHDHVCITKRDERTERQPSSQRGTVCDKQTDGGYANDHVADTCGLDPAGNRREAVRIRCRRRVDKAHCTKHDPARCQEARAHVAYSV